MNYPEKLILNDLICGQFDELSECDHMMMVRLTHDESQLKHIIGIKLRVRSNTRIRNELMID